LMALVMEKVRFLGLGMVGALRLAFRVLRTGVRGVENRGRKGVS
jgi:hypothetical protein